MIDKLNTFYGLYTKAKDRIKGVIVENYLTPILPEIFKFVQFQYIRNPQFKKNIGEYADMLFKILDNYNTQEDREKVIDCVYKNNIYSTILNQTDIFKQLSMKLVLLNEKQNIVLPEYACFLIHNKFSGVFRLQEGIYFPITPKILVILNKSSLHGKIKITENVKDYIINSLNCYAIQEVKYFVSNFNVNKSLKLHFTLTN